MVSRLAPDIVILEIDTDDLPKFGPEILGSVIEDSVAYLRVNLKVRVVCVCNVIPSGNSYYHIPSFNNRVRTLHYSEFFAGSPGGFTNPSRDLFFSDGVRVNKAE